MAPIIKIRIQPFRHSCGCFLVSRWICSMHLAREGIVGMSIHFRIPGEDEEPDNALAADASKREAGGTSTDVLFTNCPFQCVFDLTFCAVRPSTQGVRGKKGGRLSKPRRPKVYVRHQTTCPDDTLTGWGTPHTTPKLVEEGQVQRRACRSAFRVFIGGAPGTQLRWRS